MTGWREMVPRSIVLPAQHTAATIIVGIEVGVDGLVRSPGLSALAPALPPGTAPVVEQYCAAWTQWLARVERQADAMARQGG